MKTSPKPNYRDYTLEELYKAEASVDREKYPERYNEIRTIIKLRQSTEPNYDEYTLAELYEAERSVNREKYPERYNKIRARIKEINKLANSDYKCRNCGSDEYEVGEFHVTGSTIGKLFDIQGTKFQTITCRRCNYTELYKCPKDHFGNILDLFIGR